MRIGFVGSGSMAAGMARGWAAARGEPGAPTEMTFTDAGSGRAQALAGEVGGGVADELGSLAEASDALVLAVKPAALQQVAPELAASGRPVISLLGATSLEALASAFPSGQVVRVMPNLGVELRRGVMSVSYADGLDASFRDEAAEMLGLLGTVIELDDALIDPATAIMGCSPGYLALIAEILVDAGVAEQLPRDEASLMVARSMAATGELLDRYEPAELRKAVASPGGSTEAGLAALDRHSIREALQAAVDASLERMRG